MTRSRVLAVVLLAGAALLVGCTQPAPPHEGAKSTLTDDAAASIAAFKNEDASLQSLLDRSLGYAIFPDVGKAGFLAGGSYGKGEVYEKAEKIGYADITQATLGLQAGAQTFDELIVFLQAKDFDDFKDDKYSLMTNVSAVVINPGAAAATDTSRGVAVFVRSQGGLMAEAAVGGERFRFQTLAAAATQPGDK